MIVQLSLQCVCIVASLQDMATVQSLAGMILLFVRQRVPGNYTLTINLA